MTKPRLWTRDFMIISALNFLLVLVFYLLIVVIGLYATRELNATVSQAGLVVGVFIVGALVGRLIIGQLLDRIGRKRSMLIGLFLSITTSLLYFIDSGIGFLILNRFLHGIAIGIASTAIATVVAYLLPLERKGEGIGYFSLSTTVATAIGPFIGFAMIQYTEFTMILAVCNSFTVAAFLVALALQVPELEAEQQRVAARVPLSFARLLERKVVPICTINLLIGVYYSGVLSYINAYASEQNLLNAAGFFFLAYSFAVLVSRPFTGRLLDRRGANIVMYPAFVIMTLGLLVLSQANTGALLLLAGGLLGLGFGNLQSCAQAVALKLVEHERMGQATTTFYIFVDAGLGFGPYLLGLLIPYSGYANLYMLLAVLTLATAGIYHLLHGRKALV